MVGDPFGTNHEILCHDVRIVPALVNRLMALALVAALAAGCASGQRRLDSAIVTAGGRIGVLQIDESTRADVIAFAGPPDAERRGRAGPAQPQYLALGYGCGTKTSPRDTPIAAGAPGPSCGTVFYINSRTGTLETFFTTSRRYAERHGVRIGMSTSAAERLLKRRLYQGCETDVHLQSAKAFLTIAFTGGVVHLPHTAVRGGHVWAFVLHGVRGDAGVFDCM
jgi:hypothetical protein